MRRIDETSLKSAGLWRAAYFSPFSVGDAAVSGASSWGLSELSARSIFFNRIKAVAVQRSILLFAFGLSTEIKRQQSAAVVLAFDGTLLLGEECRKLPSPE